MPLEKKATPDKKAIIDVAAFLGVPVEATVKALVCTDGEGAFAMALLRGDHDLNEIKLKNAMGWDDIRMATDDEILVASGAPVGFLGPIGVKAGLVVVADLALNGMANCVIGANRD